MEVTKIPLTVTLQQKQFVDKTNNVVNYLSVTADVDGFDVVLYPKDSTAKQILNKYYVRKQLEKVSPAK